MPWKKQTNGAGRMVVSSDHEDALIFEVMVKVRGAEDRWSRVKACSSASDVDTHLRDHLTDALNNYKVEVWRESGTFTAEYPGEFWLNSSVSRKYPHE